MYQDDDNQQEKLGCLIFRHNSKFRMNWDLIVIVLAIYNCISIPYEVAFEDSLFIYRQWVMDTVNYMIDIAFGMDVVLNFRTTYINSKTGTEVIDARKITLNYLLRGRFFVDLLASIPFEMVIGWFITVSSSQIKILGLMKLVRLLRLGRIITYMKFKSSMKIGFKLV